MFSSSHGGWVVLFGMFQIQVETDALVLSLNPAWGIYMVKLIVISFWYMYIFSKDIL